MDGTSTFLKIHQSEDKDRKHYLKTIRRVRKSSLETLPEDSVPDLEQTLRSDFSSTQQSYLYQKIVEYGTMAQPGCRDILPNFRPQMEDIYTKYEIALYGREYGRDDLQNLAPLGVAVERAKFECRVAMMKDKIALQNFLIEIEEDIDADSQAMFNYGQYLYAADKRAEGSPGEMDRLCRENAMSEEDLDIMLGERFSMICHAAEVDECKVRAQVIAWYRHIDAD